MKTPIDGLQQYSDEERFGFSYETLDNYIRKGPNYCDIVTMTAILERFNASKYKLDMVHIKGPDFDFPNYLIDEYEIGK
jgi:hypothetical protein